MRLSLASDCSKWFHGLSPWAPCPLPYPLSWESDKGVSFCLLASRVVAPRAVSVASPNLHQSGSFVNRESAIFCRVKIFSLSLAFFG